MIWNREKMIVIYWPVNNCSGAKKERDFFISSLGKIQKDPFQQSQEVNFMGTAGHAFTSLAPPNNHATKDL